MSINEIIIYIMVLFMLIGAVDKCIGGKLGLSENLKKVSWLWELWLFLWLGLW